MSLRILFDARFIRTDYHDGISRYSAELGAALNTITPVTYIICDEKQRQSLPKHAETIMFHAPTSAKEPFSSLLLNKYHPDVVFSPMQTIGSFGRRFSLVLTLHDLIYYRHRTPPHHLSPLVRAGWWIFHSAYWPQRLVLNRADIIATVSNTSRDDILKARLTKRPVIVTANAPQKLGDYLKKPVDVTKSPKNLVYMGSFMEYKNAEVLIKGMSELPDYTLHLLSRISDARRAQLEKLIPKKATVVFHNGVSDEKYAQLLANRALMVSASLDEGYGLPVAEAMTLGVPAVISDMPIFHEVAGKGALYFDAHNPTDFANAVKKASDIQTFQQLSQHALRQSKQFTWEKSAKVLLDALNTLKLNR